MGENSPFDIVDELLHEKHGWLAEAKQRKKKPRNKIIRTFEYQKSMLYAIQALINQPTHEILAKLTEMADEHIAESGIDLNKSPRLNARALGRWSSERRCHKYIFYPGTEIHLGLYVTYTTPEYDYKEYDSQLKYNFKLPTSSLKLNQEEYDEYIADGILCSASKDIEKPENKSTLTAKEREHREELRKAKNRKRKKKH